MQTPSMQTIKQRLQDLNADLPPGIKATLVNNKLRYVVRTSHKGKQFSLGTFLDLESAVSALVQFKAKKTYSIAASKMATEVESLIAEAQVKEESTLINMLEPASENSMTMTQSKYDVLKDYVDEHGPHTLSAPDGKSLRLVIKDKVHIFMPDVVEAVYNSIWYPPEESTSPLPNGEEDDYQEPDWLNED